MAATEKRKAITGLTSNPAIVSSVRLGLFGGIVDAAVHMVMVKINVSLLVDDSLPIVHKRHVLIIGMMRE